ncbi:hypothetical protein PR001_g15214 [Phytophthora rubi]|uniref:Uncharacterized protein n=1 Tax=Phytophthora rubi TaxID=129364 RepID=A0A6A3L3F1_9STRA|nr:hypothetical protein PR002_g15780 [Phytophthora rubi]KAE9014121.1 hypothetical protein PR001_g15214 [Phytophthora rubi]
MDGFLVALGYSATWACTSGESAAGAPSAAKASSAAGPSTAGQGAAGPNTAGHQLQRGCQVQQGQVQRAHEQRGQV